MVGEVDDHGAIKFPVGLGIVPINDLLADVFGSDLRVGLLTGDWRISLGGKVFAVSTGKGLTNTNAPIEQLLAGVPYLRQKGPINRRRPAWADRPSDYPSRSTSPIDWAFDPADPMLYLKGDEIR